MKRLNVIVAVVPVCSMKHGCGILFRAMAVGMCHAFGRWAFAEFSLN